MILGLLAASALSLPLPKGNPGTWLMDRDYPAGALRRKEEGPVGFRLLVDPKGRAARCTVTISSGSSDLDETTCAIASSAARFKPATDETGQPNYSLYDGRLTWRLPGTARPPGGRKPAILPPVMELTAQKLPDGSREKMLWLTARFDTAGQIAACEPGNADQNEVKLAEVACAQAKAMPVEVMRDNDGNPISVIRSLNVQFKTAE